MGAAAAVLLAMWAWPKFEAAQGDDGSRASQAAYDAEDGASSAVARPRPEPARAMGTRPDRSVPDASAAELEVVPDVDLDVVPEVIRQEPAKREADAAGPAKRPPRARRGTEPAAEVSETQDVVAEAKALRAIRVSVRDQHADQALRLLRRYLSRFPTGVLRDEATLLRADALCLDGQQQEAREVAARFVRAHPSSPLTARAMDVCHEP